MNAHTLLNRSILAALIAAVTVLSTPRLLGVPGDRPSSEPASAADAGKKSPAAELYAKGRQASYAGHFSEAEKFFVEANQLEPNNPETLNMLAYVQRKQGRLEEAFANYGKALKLRPKFPEAREYLGEAHIQAALREIETLKTYGPEAEEQREDLIRALKRAAAQFP